MMVEAMSLGKAPLAEERLFEQRREDEDRSAAEQVVPEVAYFRGVKQNQNERLRTKRGDENRRAAHEAEEKSDQKYPENAAVKNRAEDINRLDQVLDQIGEEGEGNGDPAPDRGQQFRDEEIMVI